jgi:hypothetical protein
MLGRSNLAEITFARALREHLAPDWTFLRQAAQVAMARVSQLWDVYVQDELERGAR